MALPASAAVPPFPGFVSDGPSGDVPITINYHGRVGIDEMDCYSPFMIITNGVWADGNPLNYFLPSFLAQILVIVLVSRALASVLKHVHQPRVVAEILTGVLLGVSGIMSVHDHNAYLILFPVGNSGDKKIVPDILFPVRGMNVLVTASHIGLLYFVFMIGMEMDLKVLRRLGAKVLTLAAASFLVPFAVVYASATVAGKYFVGKQLREALDENDDTFLSPAFNVFLAIALSMTAFPVLALIFIDLKLISTEIARLTLSSSIVNYFLGWGFLVIAFSFKSLSHSDYRNSLSSSRKIPETQFIFLATVAFVVFCLCVVQPALKRLVQRTPEGEPMSDKHLGIILAGVMAASCTADLIGIHSIFGAFLYGICFPSGPRAAALAERLDLFVNSLLLPVYFAQSGLRMNSYILWDDYVSPKLPFLAALFALACVAKVLPTFLISLYYKMPVADGLSLSIFMNTRGVVALVILSIAMERGVMDGSTYTFLVLLSIGTTVTVCPLVKLTQLLSKKTKRYDRRSIQQYGGPDSELRILACFHNSRNVPSTIALLDLTRPSKHSPLVVFPLHLLELTGRATAMLIVHTAGSRMSSSYSAGGLPGHTNSDGVLSPFHAYQRQNPGVTIEPLTAISPYSSMQDDVRGLAEDKQAAIILLPFHKQQAPDGTLDAGNPSIRAVNSRLLDEAPCSVAILVDRGLDGADGSRVRRVAVLFFGGADDREALAYAHRMASRPAVAVTLVRFVCSAKAEAGFSTWERQMDDSCVSEFRLRWMHSEAAAYEEIVVDNSEGTVAAIRELDGKHELYLVGRSRGVASPLTAGLTMCTECPELGPIGDLLASADIGATASVLVVQQYVAGEEEAEEAEMAARLEGRSDESVQNYIKKANCRPNGYGPNWQSKVMS